MRRLGITPDMGTPHGFRASARTLLDEVLAFKKDWIEHQLAHKVREPDGRAYNRTQFLRERKDMMQTRSDYTLQYVLPTPDRASNVQLLKEIS
jgi:integrase